MTMTKDLQAIRNKLTKLAEKTEKLAAALEKTDQPTAKSVKTKTKVKDVTKKAPAKGAKKTDTDKLLAIINRSKKGVDTATLMKKTGFNQKKSPADTRETVGGCSKLNSQPLPQSDIQRVGC